MKRLVLSVLVVFAIAAAVVGCGSSNTSSGNTELQGTWKATNPNDSTMTYTFTFNGNQWTMVLALTSASQSFQESGTFTIDSAANPKTIDMLFVSSVPADSQIAGTTALGIYQLSGTSLMLGLGDPGNATRPTSFTDDNRVDLVKQ
jgi:uncharacterized protein (TIGR03067 family)